MIEHLIVIPAFMLASFGLGWYVGNHPGSNVVDDMKDVWVEIEALKAKFNAKPK